VGQRRSDRPVHGRRDRQGKRTEAAVWGAGDDVLRRGLSVAYVMGHDIASADEATDMPSSKLDEIMAAHVRKAA
jgi:hypothetical protein